MPNGTLPSGWGGNQSKPDSWLSGGKSNIASSQESQEIKTETGQDVESKPQVKLSDNTKQKNAAAKIEPEKIAPLKPDVDSLKKNCANSEILPENNPDSVDADAYHKDNIGDYHHKRLPKYAIVLIVVTVTLAVALVVVAVLYFSDKGGKSEKIENVSTQNTIATEAPKTTVAEVTTVSTEPLTTQKATFAPTEIPTTSGFNSYTMTVPLHWSVAVYKSPSYNSEILEILSTGESFTIVEEQTDENLNNWGKIDSNGGWVPLDDVMPNDDVPDDEPLETQSVSKDKASADFSTKKIDGIEFKYVTSYTDGDTSFKINTMNITKGDCYGYYDDYVIKVDGELTDKFDRGMYLAYFEYDENDYLLGKYYLSEHALDNNFKISCNLTVFNRETAKIIIDVGYDTSALD